jgi:endonuclease YncB( thermonuclease family)
LRELGGTARSRGLSADVTVSGNSLTGRARVIDGDSLDLGGERIRLYGIDAPEGRQSCNDVAGRPYACGRTASRALATAIAGRRVTCTAVDHDRYGREVAICTVDGRDLGELMVRSGHALDYAQHSRGRYAAAQREARDAKRGIWAGSFEDPAVWRRQNPR